MGDYFSFLLFLLILSLSSADDAAVMSILSAAFSSAPEGWTGTAYCQWAGVKCDASDKVISIDLKSQALSGTLPSELSLLSQLRSLAIQRNSLSGTLPSFANVSSLQELYLDSNHFTSLPPDFLLGVPTLQTLSISDNPKLSPWQIPLYLNESSGLGTFTASNSSIFGSIPDFFDSFPNFQNLRLSYNNITGVLPRSFGGSEIQNLWLNNQLKGLSGTLDVLSSMPQLSQVWLFANAFTGPVPDLSNCTNLFDLQLRDNQLTGVLPPSITELPKLINVSLQNNKLQGQFPVFKSDVENTIGDTNSFCQQTAGPCDPQVNALLAIAGGFGYPMSLAQDWTGNNACDKWPFVTCDSQGKSVTVLNFANQHFSGTISPAFANLTSLRNLMLSENDLSGTIPETLTTLDQLAVLDVSNNNLNGPVPVFKHPLKLIVTGNPNIGNNVSADDGNGNKPGPGSNSDVPTGDVPGGSKGGSSSGGMIAGVVIAVFVSIGVVFFVSYKCYIKKRYRRSGRVQSPRDEMTVFEIGKVVISVELRQVTDNFSENNILGRGGFGVVYKGDLHNGTQMAVKRMISGVMGKKGQKEFQAEIAVLTKVRHIHLVAFLGYCTNDTERLLVYEYMPQGTLSQHLFQYQELGYPPLSWKQRVTIALDVARGVEYLHTLAQSRFIHRDLKPSNILLANDMRAKVADFGLVRNIPDGKYSVETRMAGTFGYLPPEYGATGRVTTKVDVYAFGVVLMEIITGRKALDENISDEDERTDLATWFRRIVINKGNIQQAMDQTLDSDDQETFDSICRVAEFAVHCTARGPLQRPDMSHAVNVLGPLVEQWVPSCLEEEDKYDNDLHMSHPQGLQSCQSDEYTSTTEDILGNTL